MPSLVGDALPTLREQISKLKISVLPDFFLDRIISIPFPRNLLRRVELKAAAGGGSLRGFDQTEVLGGNAGNLAFALSSLSARTTLYCVGDPMTRAVASAQSSTCKLRIVEGEPGYTVALEFPFQGRRVNVMLSDVGDVGNFDGQRLTRSDIENLKKSDCIALVNWSANRKGNELARRVMDGRRRPGGLNFLDPADIQGAENRVRRLVKDVIDRGLLNVISVNENEARIIMRIVLARKLVKSYGSHEIMNAARALHASLNITVDIHTPIGSATSTNSGEAWSSSFLALDGIVTGAGDVWDAGDIIGHLLNLEDQKRLRFANACAHLYLRKKKARYPTLQEVIKFLENRAT